MYKQVYDFLNECNQNEQIKNISFGLLNKEEVLYQFSTPPYQIDKKRIMFSITKSFTSLAIGILFDKGLIKLEDPISKYFEDVYPSIKSENLLKIKVKDLLSMSSGIKTEDYKDALRDHDFIKTFFERDFVYTPGTHYLYSTRTSHILSALVKKITGVMMHEFLEENLFKKIGLDDYSWEVTKEGNSYGGSGLQVSHLMLNKLAFLLLNDGKYNGIEVVSKKYLDLATNTQVIKQDSVGTLASKSRGTGYGFQFHIVSEQEYAADGAFGQVVYVFKEYSIAVVLTSQTTDFVEIYRLIQKYFSKGIIESDFSKESLDKYVQELTYIKNDKPLKFKGNYKFNLIENTLNLKEVSINQNILKFTYLNGIVDEIDLNKRYGKIYAIKTLKYEKQDYFLNILESTDNYLEIEFLHLESPFVSKFIFKEENNEVTFEFNPQITFYMEPFKQTIKK